MDSVVAILVGIGLAASCGFRVFVPLLVTSAAASAGYLNLSDGFDWIGTKTALLAFAVAAAIEILAYTIPWLDNLLDTIASPIAVIAGMVLFAASVTGIDPFLKWTLAVIAGGGSAALVQGGTVLTRAASTTTTGGLANIVVSTLETLIGVLFSIISIAFPLLAVVLLLLLIALMYYVGRHVVRRLAKRSDTAPG
jgi:hypothetical protein